MRRLALIAILGALTAAVVLIQERKSPLPMIREISWSVLPLVAALFVLVEMLDHTGVIRTFVHLLQDATQHNEATTLLHLGLGLPADVDPEHVHAWPRLRGTRAPRDPAAAAATTTTELTRTTPRFTPTVKQGFGGRGSRRTLHAGGVARPAVGGRARTRGSDDPLAVDGRPDRARPRARRDPRRRRAGRSAGTSPG